MVDPIAEKEVIIDGKPHKVRVYPPGPEEHNETVWAHPKAGAHHSYTRRIAGFDGLAALVNDTAYERIEDAPDPEPDPDSGDQPL